MRRWLPRRPPVRHLAVRDVPPARPPFEQENPVPSVLRERLEGVDHTLTKYAAPLRIARAAKDTAEVARPTAVIDRRLDQRLNLTGD